VAATCPWCNAPRGAGPSCERCGANYAKAELIKVKGRADSAVAAEKPIEAPLGIEERAVEDPVWEFRLCAAAIPAMLVLGVLFHLVTPGLQRIALGMPVHEMGHAVSAWFTGFWAIPTLWKTIIPEERSLVASLLLAGAIGWMMFAAFRAEKTYLVVLGALLLLLQAIGTFGLREDRAVAFYTFGGDGMGMVLATALMCTFFFGKRSQLYRGSLRWGFLAIGAAAFTDMFATWLAALRDPLAIPIGEIEGVGLSDAARLLGEHLWDQHALVHRFVGVGVACLVVLALVYAWGVRLAWKKARAS
jgi:hypothetical protein